MKDYSDFLRRVRHTANGGSRTGGLDGEIIIRDGKHWIVLYTQAGYDATELCLNDLLEYLAEKAKEGD